MDNPLSAALRAAAAAALPGEAFLRRDRDGALFVTNAPRLRPDGDWAGALNRAGIRSQVISTPKDVAVGCGLSVRFELRDAQAVLDVYQRTRPGNLIGFYRVAREYGKRPAVTPL